MKKNNVLVKQVLMSILTAGILTFGLTACSDDSDFLSETDTRSVSTEPAKELADYAVLIYGHGSLMASLDLDITKNIYDCYTADSASHEKVKVAVQYKWTNPRNLKNSLKLEHFFTDFEKLTPEEKEFAKSHGSTAVRFVLDPAQKGNDPEEGKIYLGTKQMLEAPQFGEKGFDMSTPDSLTNFINWAVKACPAKHYMLVVSSHGGGYLPETDNSFRTPGQGSETRSVMPDADSGKEISAYELKAALEAADRKMDILFLDACLMNMMEVEYELRNVTDYIIASSFPVPGMGGNYRTLINELAKGNAMETALSNFCEANKDSWDELYKNISGGNYYDQSVIRTSSLDAYAAKIRDFTDRLTDAYTNGGDELRKKIDLCTAAVVKIEEEYPFYDFDSYLALITTALPEYFPSGSYEDIRNSYEQCLVKRFSSPNLEKYGYKIGLSCLLGYEGHYDLFAWERSEEGVWTVKKSITRDADLANTYQRLEWDHATGWSRWLLLNKQKPSPFCYFNTAYEPNDVIKY